MGFHRANELNNDLLPSRVSVPVKWIVLSPRMWKLNVDAIVKEDEVRWSCEVVVRNSAGQCCQALAIG